LRNFLRRSRIRSKPTGGGRDPGDAFQPLILRVFTNPHVWISTILLVALTFFYYHDIVVSGWGFDPLDYLPFTLSRHAIWRILYLVPIVYGSAFLGTGAGISMLVLSAIAMLPRALLLSPVVIEASLETVGVLIVGALLVVFLRVLRIDRQHLAELEQTQTKLNLQIRRLGMLHVITSIFTQTLDLTLVLNTVVDRIGQLLEAEAVWLHRWDPVKHELRPVAWYGVSPMASAEATALAAGLAAVVSDQPDNAVIVENIVKEPALNGTVLVREGIQVALISQLKYRGEMIGTLCAGSRAARRFATDEIDLLRAVGDEISVAVQNARYYERERKATEALRESEGKYRELFETSSDAIWVHDLQGIVIAVNRAFEQLVGFPHGELVGAHVSKFFSQRGLEQIEVQSHDRVLRGEYTPPYEQSLVRNDGAEVVLHIGTSLLIKNRQPWAIQHVGRDITEQKRAQENLRLYVQQVSQAQEAERKRIARELHDETAQALVAVVRDLDDLAEGKSKYSVKDIREQVKGVLREVRNYSQQLRPSVLDDLGLGPALKWLATDLTNNYGITTEVQLINRPRQLPKETELILFRIAQEALNNVRKHSKAAKADIKLEFSDHTVILSITDNGVGFSTPERVGDLARTGKLGLTGMQERASLLGGTLNITSLPSMGTSVTVEVPA